VALLAVPNVSEGRDPDRVARIVDAFSAEASLLDTHLDAVHNRSVLTLAAEAPSMADALARGATRTLAEIDMNAHEGAHPCIGALDVCPLVWLQPSARGEAEALARGVAASLGGLGIPVFLYGALASSPERAERAFFRHGGLGELRRRMEAGELSPDEGPAEAHPTAGATLVTARPPMAAFNVELDTGDVDAAREIAAELRESGGGLPGVRALGLPRSEGRTQVSTNVHDPVSVPLARVVEAIRELAAAHGAVPVAAEIVGLVPAAALEGYPEDVPIDGFDPATGAIERRLSTLDLG
jgi:glutamate formiminotransferase